MKILLATDESEASADAEWLLERIPFPGPLDLTIAHVKVIPSLSHLRREFPKSVDGILEQFYAHGEALIAREVSRFEGIDGKVEGCLRKGLAAETVVEIAEEKSSDLIIVGARGQSPTQQFLLGSTSASITKHAHCSVLVTRPSEKVKQPNRAFRIVVAIDGSDASQSAVEMLSTIPWGKGVEILVVSILENVKEYSEWAADFRQALEESEKASRKKLVHTAVEQLKATTSHVAGEVLRADSVVEELLKTLQRLDADLVVMGHRGMSRIKRFFLGSTCERTLRHAKCSVWIHKDSK